MTKELSYVFLCLTLISSTVVAQVPINRYSIENTLDCHLSLRTARGWTNILSYSTLKFNDNDFPFSTSGYCTNSTPFGYVIIADQEDKEYSAGCYQIKKAGMIREQNLFQLTEVDCPPVSN